MTNVAATPAPSAAPGDVLRSVPSARSGATGGGGGGAARLRGSFPDRTSKSPLFLSSCSVSHRIHRGGFSPLASRAEHMVTQNIGFDGLLRSSLLEPLGSIPSAFGTNQQSTQ